MIFTGTSPQDIGGVLMNYKRVISFHAVPGMSCG